MQQKIKKLLSGEPKKRPEVVTGNFSLHYEDLVKKNRYFVVGIVGIGLIAAAVVIPVAIYRSIAATGATSFEAEGGTSSISVTKGSDAQASGGSFIQFHTYSAIAGLSSSTTSVAKNGTFVVTATIYTHLQLTATELYVTYDPALVSYQSTDYTGSPMTQATPDNTTGVGFVRLSRFPLGPTNGSDVMVAKITFKALTTNGTTNVSIDKSKSVVYDNDNLADDKLTSVQNTSVIIQ